MASDPPKVLISYSHDSAEHAQHVLELAERLRKDGVDAQLDQYVAGTPARGWPRWMEDQLDSAEFVLVVCTETYRQRFLGREEPDNGKGADWEGSLITLELYHARSDTNKFVPVLFDRQDEPFIPRPLSGHTHYLLSSEANYADLYAFLTGQAGVPPAELGSLKTLSRNPVEPLRFPVSGITSTTLRDTLTILIPVYNEVSIIDGLVKKLRGERLIEKYRIILCDDGSTDASYAVMQRCVKGINNVTCIQNDNNKRKVGAIHRMAQMVDTPFLLTLDADCIPTEVEDDALETLMLKMTKEDYAAACFRIIPYDTNWLGSLQKLDYVIFTDTLRSILGVPVCLIGQGVLWRKDSFLEVLANHSREFYGDDLENTVIALSRKMRIYWERHTILLQTIPKRKVIGLIKQRALSWEFGMLRVLFSKKALTLGSESGAFYKNLLLIDFLAHPFRLLAVPVLLSALLIYIMGTDLYKGAVGAVYRQSLAVSFQWGSMAIISIWVVSVLNAFICVRCHIISTIKWALFNAVYLSSPFVYVAYFNLVIVPHVNAYDILGSTIHWILLGLVLTYAWWVLITLCLLWKSSLPRKAKRELIATGLWAPSYFFVLLVVCKTVGIVKYALRWLVGR